MNILIRQAKELDKEGVTAGFDFTFDIAHYCREN